MKKILTILLVLMLCAAAACAESETETPVDLASYIGKPFDELIESFKGHRWEKNGFEDGNTIYISVGDKPYAITVRTCIDEYPDYGWEADTVFYLGTTVEEYTLAGCSVGEYLPDVDARLTTEGWIKMEEDNDYAIYEKTYGDVRYTLDLLAPRYEYEYINRITLKGTYLGENQKDGVLDWLFG